MVTSNELSAALQILAGDPELVIVDARVLRLLMGDLAELIILEAATGPIRWSQLPEDEEAFVWDEDSFPCKW